MPPWRCIRPQPKNSSPCARRPRGMCGRRRSRDGVQAANRSGAGDLMAEDDPSDEDDPSEEIAMIEARLEHLAEVSERCRKIILFSKAAIAGGAALLIVTMLGLLGSNQIVGIGSMAAVLGGIVSLGSNGSTLQQTTAAMSA